MVKNNIKTIDPPISPRGILISVPGPQNKFWFSFCGLKTETCHFEPKGSLSYSICPLVFCNLDAFLWNTILSCCVHEDLVGLGRRLNLTRLDDHQPVKRSSFVPPDPQDPTRGRDKVELVNTSLLRRLLSGPWHCQQFSVSQSQTKPDQTCYCWFEEENMFAQIF